MLKTKKKREEKMLNNKKPTLYIDFDNTLVNSIKKIVELWQRKYNGTSRYKPIHWTEIETYDFKELNVSKDEIKEFFNTKEFFQKLEFCDNAEVIIKFLYEQGFKIVFVSMGQPENLALKKEWLSKHNILKNTEFIGIDINNYKDKSHIDMSDGILIDDEIRYLETSNAVKKVCFGDEYEWNRDWLGKRCWNWYEVYDFIAKYCEN